MIEFKNINIKKIKTKGEWKENPYIDEKTFDSLKKIKEQVKKTNIQMKHFIEIDK